MARLQVADEAEAVAVMVKSAQLAADVVHGVARSLCQTGRTQSRGIY